MDKAMLAALAADGEKLRQLTGEDHGPDFLPEPCPECGDVVGSDGDFCDECGWLHFHNQPTDK